MTSLVKTLAKSTIAICAVAFAQPKPNAAVYIVGNPDGRDAGAQYVCVVQRSELDGVSYVATRMVSVQSKVAEPADIVELPPGGKIIDIIQRQIG